MYYYYYGYGWYDHVVDVWDTQLAVAVVIFGVMLFCVWRLWRGMQLDDFEKNLRTLRQQPNRRLAVETAEPTTRKGRLQISLLPLMLVATGLAMLLAQAQQPDDLSRPATWAVFVIVASFYGTHAWRHIRGFGPLRNFALAGALSAAAISAILWAFYMGVDQWWSAVRETPAERLTARLPQLLWWTAVGGALGSLLGAARAHRYSNRLHLEEEPGAAVTPEEWFEATAVARDEESPVLEARSAIQVEASPGRRRLIGGFAVGCIASMLFHLSAAPHLNRVIRLKHYYYWHHHWSNAPSDPLTLTMSSVSAPQTPLWASTTIQDPYQPTRLTTAATPISRSAAAVREIRTVVVPIRNIKRGERLRPQDFRESVREINVSVGMLQKATDVAGSVAAEDLIQGQPMNSASLATAVDSSSYPIVIDGSLAFPGSETPMQVATPTVPNVTPYPTNLDLAQSDAGSTNTRFNDVTFNEVVVTDLTTPVPNPLVGPETRTVVNDIDIGPVPEDGLNTPGGFSPPYSGPVPNQPLPGDPIPDGYIAPPMPSPPPVGQPLPSEPPAAPNPPAPSAPSSSGGYAGPGPIPGVTGQQQAGFGGLPSGVPGTETRSRQGRMSGPAPNQVGTFEDTFEGLGEGDPINSIQSELPLVEGEPPVTQQPLPATMAPGVELPANFNPPAFDTARSEVPLPEVSESVDPFGAGVDPPNGFYPPAFDAVDSVRVPVPDPFPGSQALPVNDLPDATPATPATGPQAAGGGLGIPSSGASPFGESRAAPVDQNGPLPEPPGLEGQSNAAPPAGGMGDAQGQGLFPRSQSGPVGQQPRGPNDLNLSSQPPRSVPTSGTQLNAPNISEPAQDRISPPQSADTDNGERGLQWASSFQIDIDQNGKTYVTTAGDVGRAAGLLPGDRILSVRQPQGMTVAKLLTLNAPAKLVLEVKQPSGTSRTVTVEKDPGSLVWLRTVEQSRNLRQ